MAVNSQQNNTTYIVIGLAAIATAAALYFALSPKKSSDGATDKSSSKDNGGGSTITPIKSNVQGGGSSGSSTATAATADNTSKASAAASNKDDEEKQLNRRIEEIDRAGKALFKNKQYMEAAETFTEALDLIESKKSADKNSSKEDGGPKSSLTRQIITLTNNRSAMYEKASFPDLALSDCDAVLDLDPAHAKARTRRLRILESQKRHREALVEVCALQLKYMNDNRDKLRLGLPPLDLPPVPQSKIEELVAFIQPEEIERAQKALAANAVESRALPSSYTIIQLLKSFSGFNKWMSDAAKGGTVAKFTSQLEDLLEGVPRKSIVAFADNLATKAVLLLNRGRRYAFEKDFSKAVKDFDEAYALVEDKDGSEESDHDEVKKAIVSAMGNDDYCRLLEWCGMCKHLRFDLKGALECYERCSKLEPENTELLVKRAGVNMDGANYSEADALFKEALALNPSASDALLHRANLRMLQQRIQESESDLETCIRLYPNNLLARLRLATVLMTKEDFDGAKKMLEKAEEYDPDSSEVHCYRGELHFAKGDFNEAKSEFQKAMECDTTNPTPCVNLALAVMNTPAAMGVMPDFAEAIRLLEKAIEVDPMFHAAYVQLGQMKLSMATDLSKAREVVELYDKGLEFCRTPGELTDICSMRILTVAQIDAAHALHMETLNMQ